MASSTNKLVAVVTGASSGIGAATALSLASKGYEVIGLARRVDRVTELATKAKGGKIYAKACDIAVEEQVIEAFEWIKDKFGGVDVLINNAGVYKSRGAIHGKYEDWKALFDLHVLGSTLCTKEALKTMKQRGDNGVIVNISSIVGKYVPLHTDIGMYSASKHAVTVLSEAISNELMREKSKIRVTNISPGMIFTEMMLKGKAEATGSPYDLSVLQGSLPENCLDPQDVADSIMFVLSMPSRVQIPELTIQPIGQDHL